MRIGWVRSLWVRNFEIFILGTRELGLVKDTPGWTSPISSCAGPPWTSPSSSGVRLKTETMFDFFDLLKSIDFFKNLVRHGPLVNHDDLGMN